MRQDRTIQSDPRISSALDELRGVIACRYPTATFDVVRGHDDPENVHLLATVDVDDPDQVLDLVLDRLLELQVDERLPVYVIPVRTPERLEASRSPELQGKGRAKPADKRREK
ncbi:MAG TPA: hypothetical protein VII06_01280 [Chloroflexota bacterium]|jgi:hypothetical protein